MDENPRFSIESKGKFFDEFMAALNDGDEVLLLSSKKIKDHIQIRQAVIRLKEECPVCDKMAPLFLLVQGILNLIEDSNLPHNDVFKSLISALYKDIMDAAHADSSHQEVID